jgi:tetrahydromethanopterin S-methyltransferase subunit H
MQRFRGADFILYTCIDSCRAMFMAIHFTWTAFTSLPHVQPQLDVQSALQEARADQHLPDAGQFPSL